MRFCVSSAGLRLCSTMTVPISINGAMRGNSMRPGHGIERQKRCHNTHRHHSSSPVAYDDRVTGRCHCRMEALRGKSQIDVSPCPVRRTWHWPVFMGVYRPTCSCFRSTSAKVTCDHAGRRASGWMVARSIPSSGGCANSVVAQ